MRAFSREAEVRCIDLNSVCASDCELDAVRMRHRYVQATLSYS